MPKGLVAPREVTCRACQTRFVTRARAYRARQATLKRQRDAEYDALVPGWRTLPSFVRGRMQAGTLTFDAIRTATLTLYRAEGYAAKASACRLLAVTALALEAELRRRAARVAVLEEAA